MNQLNLLESEALQKAVEADLGVTIKAADLHLLKKYRRRLYAVRAALKKNGCRSYDGLSFVLVDNELLVVQRDKAMMGREGLPVEISPLTAEQLPLFIRARGQSKLTFHRIS